MLVKMELGVRPHVRISYGDCDDRSMETLACVGARRRVPILYLLYEKAASECESHRKAESHVSCIMSFSVFRRTHVRCSCTM